MSRPKRMNHPNRHSMHKRSSNHRIKYRNVDNHISIPISASESKHVAKRRYTRSPSIRLFFVLLIGICILSPFLLMSRFEGPRSFALFVKHVALYRIASRWLLRMHNGLMHQNRFNNIYHPDIVHSQMSHKNARSKWKCKRYARDNVKRQVDTWLNTASTIDPDAYRDGIRAEEHIILAHRRIRDSVLFMIYDNQVFVERLGNGEKRQHSIRTLALMDTLLEITSMWSIPDVLFVFDPHDRDLAGFVTESNSGLPVPVFSIYGRRGMQSSFMIPHPVCDSVYVSERNDSISRTHIVSHPQVLSMVE